MRAAWIVLVGLGGCVKSSVVNCDYGETCGAGLQCDVTHHLCVSAEAMAACSGLADRMTCSYAEHSGECDAGVCLEVLCGDGVRGGLEECDGVDLGAATSCTDLGYYDEGTIGCTDGCKFEVTQCHRRCGDGTVDPEEQCDPATALDP